MAKVIINVDTEIDSLSVNVDGQEIANVNGVSVYLMDSYRDAGEKELSLNISCLTRDKESGLTTYTNLMAADTKESKQLKSQGAKLYSKNKDFIVLKDFDKVKFDILEHFG